MTPPSTDQPTNVSEGSSTSSPFHTIVNPDIILRSSDATDFLMSKSLLAQSSAFFEQMLSLPQPTEERAETEYKDGLPVVPVAEPAKVLGVLLRFCIPHAPPKLEDLATVLDVLEGAKKYRVNWAFAAACEALRNLAETEPVRAYAIACQYGLEREARQAALFTLRLSVSSIVAVPSGELQWITAEYLRRLLYYRDRCSGAVTTRISSRECIQEYYRRFRHSAVWCNTCCGPTASRAGERVQSWWDQYMKQLVENLKVSTWEGTVCAEDALSAFISGGPCAKCCGMAAPHLTALTEYLAAQVAGAISKVTLEFNAS